MHHVHETKHQSRDATSSRCSSCPIQPSKFPYNNVRTRFPHLADSGLDLLNCLMALDPAKRLNAIDAQRHAWFREKPYAKEAAMMPTFPTQHDEMERREKERDRAAIEASAAASAASRLLREDLFRSGPPRQDALGLGLGGVGRVVRKKMG
jgi:serine/threonine protein kinase